MWHEILKRERNFIISTTCPATESPLDLHEKHFSNELKTFKPKQMDYLILNCI